MTKKTEIKGIDVSSYQGNINWKKVADAGCQFAILRGTLKDGSMDTAFERNFKDAQANGLDVAVYQFSYALSIPSSIASANNLIHKLNGRKLAIWLDLEWSVQGALGKKAVTEIAEAYVNTCKQAGYDCHIYSNLDWYKNRYYPERLKQLGCKFWIARYGNNSGQYKPSYKPNVEELIWQYSSRGKIPGISSYVDLNMMYP
ncbi:hypothetical protein D7X88_08720 [bacterium C-53]|nr:hypothetical protein [Lachnospiraceae bacterium]NBI02188.1 hypothetical protein [Lachnospiraceae bacterium]RKJ10440.1 hypothetical protein D7X88_08720 [bacterium C-53]